MKLINDSEAISNATYPALLALSLIHISEPTRHLRISFGVFSSAASDVYKRQHL
ncbi:hypothetical protein ACX3V1_28780 [Escherichia coli]